MSNASADKRQAAPPLVDQRTQLGRRCRAAVGKTTDQTAHMLERALDSGIDADYMVAFDSKSYAEYKALDEKFGLSLNL